MMQVASAATADQVHNEIATVGLDTELEPEIKEVRLYNIDGLARNRSTNKPHV